MTVCAWHKQTQCLMFQVQSLCWRNWFSAAELHGHTGQFHTDYKQLTDKNRPTHSGTDTQMKMKSLCSVVQLQCVFQDWDQHSEDEKLQQLQRLKLRYFTPREVANLMGFPAHFSESQSTTPAVANLCKRQKWQYDHVFQRPNVLS